MTKAQDDLRRLVEGLYLGTESGKISWAYDASNETCEADLGEGYVQVLRETDEDGDYFTYIKVLNGRKQVVDNVYGGTLGNGTPVNTKHENYWALMSDLMKISVRQALGADAVISSILNDLGVEGLSLEKPPF